MPNFNLLPVVLPVVLPAVALLSACESTTTPVEIQDALSSYATAQARVDALPRDTSLPNGSAVFAGQLSGPVTLNRDSSYAVLGDARFSVDFTRPASLTGRINNIELIKDGTSSTTMGGELTVSGSPVTTAGPTAGNINGIATGNLTLDASRSSAAAADVQIALSGEPREDGTRTSLTGNWQGGTTPDINNDFVLTGTAGTFFADQL